MKATKITVVSLLLGVLTLLSCTKEPVKGDKGDKGDAGRNGIDGINGTNGQAGTNGTNGTNGQDGEDALGAKTFNFSLTFNVGDTYKSYNGITGYDADDVILFFVHYESLGSTAYWSSLPMIFSSLNIIPEFSDQTGMVFINTLKSNGTSGSPWASTTTLNFKAVLIKSSQMIANPNVDYTNYNEVKNTFNLKD